jgi:hypothetical protein
MVSELLEAVGQQSAGQTPATHHSAVPLKSGEVLYFILFITVGKKFTYKPQFSNNDRKNAAQCSFCLFLPSMN